LYRYIEAKEEEAAASAAGAGPRAAAAGNAAADAQREIAAVASLVRTRLLSALLQGARGGGCIRSRIQSTHP
jgi:hypothetical protein